MRVVLGLAFAFLLAGIMIVVGFGSCTNEAEAKLKPEYKALMDDMGAVDRAISGIEEALHVGLAQAQRARAGVNHGRSGDTSKELAALADTVKEAARRVEVAQKPLRKVDDGEPDYVFSASSTGEAAEFKPGK